MTIMNDPTPTFVSQSGTELILAPAQCEEPGFSTLILSYPSYFYPLDYVFEIIQDESLLVDSIEAPTLREIEFITGFSTIQWQECIFALKTSADTEASFCGSFSYAFSSDSGID